MDREDLTDEGVALRREHRITSAAVRGAVLALNEPFLLQPVDEKGDPTTRNEYPALDLTKECGPLVMQHLEDGELPDC